MPKLKPSPIKAQTEIVQANIRAKCAWFDCLTEQEIADKLGMKRSTYYTKKMNPGLWRLDELAKAAQALKCSLSWLMADHSEETKGEY